jgi:hypothetical protein
VLVHVSLKVLLSMRAVRIPSYFFFLQMNLQSSKAILILCWAVFTSCFGQKHSIVSFECFWDLSKGWCRGVECSTFTIGRG